MKRHLISFSARGRQHDGDRAEPEASDQTVPLRRAQQHGDRRRALLRGIGRATVPPPEDEEETAQRRRRKRSRRRRRRLGALAAVVSILAGLAIVGGTVFAAGVDLPDELDDALDQNSTVYYSDGKTVMGTLGVQRRTSVPLSAIPDHLEWALIAAEDQEFYQHSGVDFPSVMRALWNNVTGGDTQGASTLTQQYVGQVADIRGDGSYLRKAREAVMAMKMDSDFSKADILDHYLNLVYFGRGAYGVEAAAQAFFDRPVSELDVSQSALLVAQVKAPDGSLDPRDPLGLGEHRTRQAATERWNYVLDQLVEIGKLDAAERAAITELPTTADPEAQIGDGYDTPTGFVSHKYVLRELNAAGYDTDDIQRGGYRIVTTVDARLQQSVMDDPTVAELDADEDADAGVVAIDPTDGGVLAYYGGRDGTGIDNAGSGAMHPPGTSANIIPALTAVESGSSVLSMWDGSSPREFATRLDEDGASRPVLNTGGANEPEVSLAEAVRSKLDTPMYAVGEWMGIETMADTARQLGITTVGVPGEDEPADLPADIDRIDHDFALGANAVSVLESATMYATLANSGERSKTHFVDHVSDADGENVFRSHSSTGGGVDASAAADITAVLADELLPTGSEADETTDPPEDAAIDADSSEETLDSWPLRPMATNASPTWYCGYIPQLAISVWAGDDRHEGDGSSPDDTVAQEVWTSVMGTAVAGYQDDIQYFDKAPLGGDPESGELPATRP